MNLYTGFTSSIPIVGLLFQSNSKNDLISEVTGTKKSTLGTVAKIGGAAADKADILQFIVFHFKADFTGTDALCLKIHNLLPPDDSFYKWICKYNIPHLFIK